jgi:adenylate cyclase
MGADEARTVQDLKGHQAVVLPMIGRFGGRIIDTAGDGILAEFNSVANAVECAVAIQDTMRTRNAETEAHRKMQYRIGINLGDVIYDESRIYGDGINIAARLEGLAEPGGICISRKVYEDVRGKIDLSYDDMGEQQLKNIAQTVRCYRVRGIRKTTSLLGDAKTLALPDKPSIAVLPFTNLSGDPDQEYFGDGIAEDILTDLAKLRWLFVIARNSSFTFRGKAVDVRLVSRGLGVRYVLEGSVRRAGNRVRVTAQLIDATTGSHVWASRYDRDLADIFAVQDEITAAIAAAIAPAIIDAEQQRALHKSAERLDAWEAYQRGMWHFAMGGRENIAMARAFLEKAVDLDPNFAAVYAALAGIVIQSGSVFHIISLDEAARTAEQLARKALSLDPSDAVAHVRLAGAMYIAGDLEGCISECNEALALDTNCAFAYGIMGTALVFAGRREEARTSLRTCLRLNPRDPIAPVDCMKLHSQIIWMATMR